MFRTTENECRRESNRGGDVPGSEWESIGGRQSHGWCTSSTCTSTHYLSKHLHQSSSSTYTSQSQTHTLHTQVPHWS